MTIQGCRKLLKVGGGGANGAAKSGGPVGDQIGAKSWIFQTELGPIPVTRCDQCFAIFHQVEHFQTTHNTFSRVKNTKPSGAPPPVQTPLQYVVLLCVGKKHHLMLNCSSLKLSFSHSFIHSLRLQVIPNETLSGTLIAHNPPTRLPAGDRLALAQPRLRARSRPSDLPTTSGSIFSLCNPCPNRFGWKRVCECLDSVGGGIYLGLGKQLGISSLFTTVLPVDSQGEGSDIRARPESSEMAASHFLASPSQVTSHFLASPSQVTSHFLASPSQVTSHFLASPSQVTSHLVRRQVKSQVIWSKHKSSHKSLCPSTSQVAPYFFHSRHKKRNIIKSKRK